MTDPRRYEELSGPQKAAVVILALGEDSTEVLRRMGDAELARLSAEIAALRDIDPLVEEAVLRECQDKLKASPRALQGGPHRAESLLEEAVGRDRALAIMARSDGAGESRGFRTLEPVQARQLARLVQTEHPQTIALILTQLRPEQAAGVLSALPAKLQADVALRVATMEEITPEILKHVESALEQELHGAALGQVAVAGGSRQIAKILKLMEAGSHRSILSSLQDRVPDLALEIRNRMYAFEDIASLDDRSVQRLLRDIPTRDLARALQTASAQLKSRIFANVSERVEAVLREEMEFLGTPRGCDVEACQMQILEAVRELEESGQIARAGSDRSEACG